MNRITRELINSLDQCIISNSTLAEIRMSEWYLDTISIKDVGKLKKYTVELEHPYDINTYYVK